MTSRKQYVAWREIFANSDSELSDHLNDSDIEKPGSTHAVSSDEGDTDVNSDDLVQLQTTSQQHASLAVSDGYSKLGA